MFCPICDQKGPNCDCTATERAQHGLLEDALAEITRLREERRWIPVAERLPNAGGEDVFVAHGEWEDGSRSLNMGWWNGREWMFYRSKCGMPPVTHWMPLPAPPNGGGVE